MELKPGYKQTEVGVIPEDWVIQSLDKLTDSQRPISYGIVQTGPIIPNGVKCLRVVDIENGQINKNDLITTTQTISNAYKRTILRTGDLVMPLRGKVGDVALVDQDLVGANLTRGVALIAIRSDMSALFFKQLISSIAIRNKLAKSMNGSALQEIPIATLRGFKIGFPSSFAEQTAIANTLSDADALIQSLTSLIAKKRQIKQGAMQTLLNPHENGRLKEGWVMKKLGESCEMYSGGTPSTSVTAYYGGDIQWITSGDLNKGIITEVKGRITKMGLINSSAKTITRDTLLIALYGATSGVVAISKINAAINQAVLAIIPDESLKSVFLFYMLTYLKDWIIATYTQGGQPNLSGNILKSIEFYCPDVDEQTRIATILSDIDAEIAALETKLAKYRHIKQGMMQNLLTGRIRLVQPDNNIGAVA